MRKKHYIYSLVISLWAVVFFGGTEDELSKISNIFNPGWQGLVKAILVGALIGLLFRIEKTRNHIERLSFKLHFASVFAGVLGLGFMALGFWGALIIYLRFGNMELLGVPLHCLNLGLAMFIIYCIMNWRRNEI